MLQVAADVVNTDSPLIFPATAVPILPISLNEGKVKIKPNTVDNSSVPGEWTDARMDGRAESILLPFLPKIQSFSSNVALILPKCPQTGQVAAALPPAAWWSFVLQQCLHETGLHEPDKPTFFTILSLCPVSACGLLGGVPPKTFRASLSRTCPASHFVSASSPVLYSRVAKCGEQT